MPDALSDATLTIYPGLGPALEIHWLVLPSGWVQPDIIHCDKTFYIGSLGFDSTLEFVLENY